MVTGEDWDEGTGNCSDPFKCHLFGPEHNGQIIFWKHWCPMILVRSRRWACFVTWFCYHLIAKPGNWFCYHLIAKPGNKTGTPSWPDQYSFEGEFYGKLSNYQFLKCIWKLHMIKNANMFLCFSKIKSAQKGLAHWDPVIYIYYIYIYMSVNCVITGSGNWLLKIWHQAITSINADSLSVEFLGTTICESYIKIHWVSRNFQENILQNVNQKMVTILPRLW